MSLMARKIILWLVVGILGVGLLFFWAKNTQENFKGFQFKKFVEDLNFPKINYGQENTTTTE